MGRKKKHDPSIELQSGWDSTRLSVMSVEGVEIEHARHLMGDSFTKDILINTKKGQVRIVLFGNEKSDLSITVPTTKKV